MKFKLEINCTNAAFGESLYDLRSQVAGILHSYAEKLMDDDHSFAALRDENGNTCGFCEFVSEDCDNE